MNLLPIRDTLFGDLPVDLWLGNGTSSQPFPWNAFIEARAHLAAGSRNAAIRKWRDILAHPGLEPRHYLQAWQFLRQNGQQPAPEIAKQLLGVVVEVGMAGGLDIVAAYPDHSARYYNYSGSAVIWEHPDTSIDVEIDALLAASTGVVQQTGPWDKPRPAAPATDVVRLSFLTPSGLHFGQAGMEVMSKDPIGSQVLNLAAGLMNALIERTLANRKSA
jgi:hypothetical protein